MGYNTSTKSVTAAKLYLDTLKEYRGDKIVWVNDNARNLCYKIHKALAAAKEQKVPGYEDLKDIWQVGHSKGEVTAKRRVSSESRVMLVAQDAIDLVEKAWGYKGVRQTLMFNNLPDDQYEDVLTWWQANKNDLRMERTKDNIIIQWK